MSHSSPIAHSPVPSVASFRRRCLKWLGACLVAVMCVSAFFLLMMSVTTPREAPRRSQCKNNLKQIGLALHNYHEVYGCFPPTFVADDSGRPMHSWRVLLLPYLDQAPLYKEYRFDEPWDGPNNRKLAGKIGDIFRCPSDKVVAPGSAASFTNYVGVVGRGTAWPGATSTHFKDFKDGTSNSILVIEVADSGIHWMEPRDLHVLQMSPTINPKAGQGISSRHKGGAIGLLADGSVRFLSEKLTAETIRGLLTIQGGETIPEDL